jgi:porphobilinogen synthase
MFPLQRNRRLRSSAAIRSLVQQHSLSVNDFLVPIFVEEGKNIKHEIASMPGYYRYSLDTLKKEVEELQNLGLKGILLFAKIDDRLKDNTGKAALDPKGLMQNAVATIKNVAPEIMVLTDVALDPYSSFGHDGIVENNKILNDATVEVLTAMACSHIEAGADGVAPSDMMDGRILAIRQAFENQTWENALILSYSAKYASSFYGPFRTALDSAPGFGDKKTYQMDFANQKEALDEALNDLEEGADILMVKPGIAYLDIVSQLAQHCAAPIAAYQVSGEYAMLKAAAEKGWLDYNEVMMEQLLAFKRAGAALIATYHAKEAAKLLK